MMNRRCLCSWTVIMLFVITVLFTGHSMAAEQTGEYLRYQEPQQTASTSWLSTMAYVLSLLLTFALVLLLAYFASRILGQKMGSVVGSSENRILTSLPLGPNRFIYVVEVAGKYLIVGVTEQAIQLLDEVTDPTVIERLKQQPLYSQDNPLDRVFQKQITSLQHLSRKFPSIFDPDKRKH